MSTSHRALDFDLLMPARIVFGWGRRSEAGRLACTLGNRAFVVCGSRSLERSGIIAQIEESLRRAGLTVVRLTTISNEPLVSDVDVCVEELLGRNPAPGILSSGSAAARRSTWRKRSPPSPPIGTARCR